MRWVLFSGVGAFVALVGACGGKAVIDGEPGTGGAGGTTTSGGGAPNGGAPNGGPGPGNQVQTSVFVSTAAGPPPPLCNLDSDDLGCNQCAFDFCQFELGNCCAATGCIDLTECVIDECQGAQDQTTCAVNECPDEVAEASGGNGIDAAEQLGQCLSGCGCG